MDQIHTCIYPSEGILIVLGFILVAYIFKMNTILWIFRNLANVLVIGVIVIFQPELRKALEQLGQKKFVSNIIPLIPAGKCRSVSMTRLSTNW